MYRVRISGATFTSFSRSSDALPTQCTRLRLAPSLHTHSIISVSAAYSAPTFTVQGLVYAIGSENVTSISSAPKRGRRIPLGHAQPLRVRMAGPIEPCAGVEAVALDDERVAVPAPNGVPHPRRVRLRLERAAVHPDLAIREIGIEHHDELRCLDDARHL